MKLHEITAQFGDNGGLIGFLEMLQDLKPWAIQAIQTYLTLTGQTPEEAIAAIASNLDEHITWSWLGEGKFASLLATRLESQDGPKLQQWLTRVWEEASEQGTGGERIVRKPGFFSRRVPVSRTERN